MKRREKIIVGGIMFLLPLILEGQWERWQPWLKDIGITPYADLNFKSTKPDSLGKYKLFHSAIDFAAGVQMVIPPWYIRMGFGNIFNMLFNNDDSTFCPMFADWRAGAQLTYEEITTYDLSISFIKSFKEEDFMGLILELGYGRIVSKLRGGGGVQILGNLGLGKYSWSVPDTGKAVVTKDRTVINLQVGSYLRFPFLSAYFIAGVNYPLGVTQIEIYPYFGVGVVARVLKSYVMEIPTTVYPKIFRGPPKKKTEI
jgi:hypothetical protein